MKLGIGVDVEGNFTNKGYERKRTQILAGYGLKTLRFTNDEALQDWEGFVGELKRRSPNSLNKGEQEEAASLTLWEKPDVAIFSLSLMGANFTDYLREAHRTLKLDSQLHLLEASSRISDRVQLRTNLETLRFNDVSIHDMWKLIYIHALKTEHPPQKKVKLRL